MGITHEGETRIKDSIVSRKQSTSGQSEKGAIHVDKMKKGKGRAKPITLQQKRPTTPASTSDPFSALNLLPSVAQKSAPTSQKPEEILGDTKGPEGETGTGERAYHGTSHKRGKAKVCHFTSLSKGNNNDNWIG